MVLGCMSVYGVLFATGSYIYGNSLNTAILSTVAVAAAAGIVGLKFND